MGAKKTMPVYVFTFENRDSFSENKIDELIVESIEHRSFLECWNFDYIWVKEIDSTFKEDWDLYNINVFRPDTERAIIYNIAKEAVKEVVEDVEPKTGNRFNKGKLRWRNFPTWLIEDLIRIGESGEAKYGTFNFLAGLSTLDTLDSLHRHLNSFESPYASDFDDESKINHLYHVAWNAIVAAHMIKIRPDLDDRFKIEE